MPELPEVEIARRNLARWWEGRRVEAAAALDNKVFREGKAAGMVGKTVARARRRGKFLLVDLEGGSPLTLVIHLRMTGKVVPLREPRARTRATFDIEGAGRFGFVDTRRLGHLDLVTPEAVEGLGVLGRLGPEPWPQALSGERLASIFKGTRRALKVALMDQELLAGVGNIVAAEALWEARLDPRLSADQVPAEALERLGTALAVICQRTIEQEEGEEIAYLHDPEAPEAHNPFLIYQASRCPRCQGEVGRLTQSGRSTYWCPTCQGGGGA